MNRDSRGYVNLKAGDGTEMGMNASIPAEVQIGTIGLSELTY
jgi:hypothetical protein